MPVVTTITDFHGQTAFTAAIGSAIARWVNVETQLCNIFLAFTDARNRNAANAAFHAIRGFEGQLAMTHAAAKVYLGDDPLLKDRFKEWGAFRNRMIKTSQKRNDLAHYMILFEGTADGNVPYLVPNIADQNFRKAIFSSLPDREDKYSTEDIWAVYHLTENLANELRDWWRKHFPLPARRATSPQQ